MPLIDTPASPRLRTGTSPAVLHRRRYPSDLSDGQWERVRQTVAPKSAPPASQRTTNLREVVNALNYRWQTGCPWRMLPHDFPPWPTVYRYVRQWHRKGILTTLREALLRRK